MVQIQIKKTTPVGQENNPFIYRLGDIVSFNAHGNWEAPVQNSDTVLINISDISEVPTNWVEPKTDVNGDEIGVRRYYLDSSLATTEELGDLTSLRVLNTISARIAECMVERIG